MWTEFFHLSSDATPGMNKARSFVPRVQNTGCFHILVITNFSNKHSCVILLGHIGEFLQQKQPETEWKVSSMGSLTFPK
jgi:hypothetical protein